MTTILDTLRANLLHAARSQTPATIGGGEFSPDECREAAQALAGRDRDETIMRCLKRIETRLCKVAIHVGASDAARIPATREANVS